MDAEAHEIASIRLQSAKQMQNWNCKVDLLQCNYSDIKKAIRKENPAATADAILLDLGVSSMQVGQCHLIHHHTLGLSYEEVCKSQPGCSF